MNRSLEEHLLFQSSRLADRDSNSLQLYSESTSAVEYCGTGTARLMVLPKTYENRWVRGQTAFSMRIHDVRGLSVALITNLSSSYTPKLIT